MKKIFSVILLFLFSCIVVQATSASGSLNSVINQSGIPKSSVSVSIKNSDTGKVVYSLNDKILMHPASVQKMLTIVPAIDALGEDYKFTTYLYSRGENEYVMELGADPYLKTKDLQKLVSLIDGKTIKKLYIDDSIIEKKSWGEGWQWDDDLNVLMPRFNAYNLDSNLMKITVMPSGKGQEVIIINQNKSPVTFINCVSLGDKNNIKVTRDNTASTNTITLTGVVKSPQEIVIPINNPERYFNAKLTNVMERRNIYLKEYYSFSKVKPSDKLKGEVNHPISIAISDILENSNNMVSETLVKVASQKTYGETGTDTNGIKLFQDYCKKIGLNTSTIRLTDASGVSKNNLVSTDFITEFLIKNKDNKTLAKLAAPGTGTLISRMAPLKDNLRAKTGTLSDISSIAGFLETKKGNHYVFSIIINDPNSTSSDKKVMEDYFIREMYLKL